MTDEPSSKKKKKPTQVSKMVTKMVRHYDQDEREQDGRLLRGFAQERATYFSDKYWMHLIQQGSGKTRTLLG